MTEVRWLTALQEPEDAVYRVHQVEMDVFGIPSQRQPPVKGVRRLYHGPLAEEKEEWVLT
jgi:hypothetical protein